ncbi:MAG: DUF4386 family protein [Candidatus Moraniibacteriota bacterium]
MKDSVIKVGGLFSLFGGLAFVGVFTYLAVYFNYPDILDGDAYQVLPKLVAGGSEMRTIWAIYAFLPLVLIPAGLGSYAYLKERNHSLALGGLLFATVAALANMLGLMRWPSIHWILAEGFASSTAEQQATIDAVFQGLNVYLGNYIGEFLGEITLNAWFLTIGLILCRVEGKIRYFGFFALLTAVLGFIGAFRNVTSAVSMVSEINNSLLPVFLVALGILLIRAKKAA